MIETYFDERQDYNMRNKPSQWHEICHFKRSKLSFLSGSSSVNTDIISDFCGFFSNFGYPTQNNVSFKSLYLKETLTWILVDLLIRYLLG